MTHYDIAELYGKRADLEVELGAVIAQLVDAGDRTAGIVAHNGAVAASAGSPKLTDEEVEATAPRREPRFRLTDTGNASRFAEDHAGELIYVVGPGWHAWDGRRWLRDNEVAPHRAAKATALRMREEASALGDHDIAQAVFRWAIASESRAKLNNMVDLAKVGEVESAGLVRAVENLDCKPHLLTCANGTLNLKTGKRRPHKRADYLTRMSPVEYARTAKAPRWRRFLEETFDGDAETIAYVQRAVGYALTGETTEQAMFIAHGAGANGKTVFIETVAALLGDYAATAAGDTFIHRRGAGPTNDLARLHGSRLVRVGETEDGAALARQVIKRVTGGDKIAARFHYREFFEYVPTYKTWLITNHLPSIPHTDGATWRRIRLIPFEVTVPAKRRDRELGRKLRRELPGILAWAVQGARDWYDGGLAEPATIREAVAAYREEQDTVGRFLRQEMRDDEEGRSLMSYLYSAYRQWCEDEGTKPISGQAFHGALDGRGYGRVKDPRGQRYRTGLAPKAHE